MSTDPSSDSGPKPRSFADAAALLPSVVPSPKSKPAERPPAPQPPAPHQGMAESPAPLPVPGGAAGVGIFAAAFPLHEDLSPGIGPNASMAGPAPAVRRAVWGLALALAAAAGVCAAWYETGNGPGIAALPVGVPALTAQASGPGARTELPPASGAPPRPDPDADSRQAAAANPLPAAGRPAPEPRPALPAAMLPGPAAEPAARSTPETATQADGALPAPFSLIVLHPRPASAAGEAANARIAALLQPITARLDVGKKAGTKGRLTVHYFHGEDAEAAKTLADTVRTPCSRVHIRGPVRTQAAWPRNAFEVWLRGP